MAQTNLQVVISAKDQFSGTANKVIGSLNRMDSAAGRVGRGTGQLAGGFARVGVVAATAAAGGLTYVAKKSIEWESALAGVNKTMDLTSDELSGLGTDIRKLATTIPLSATEIAGLVEQAGALGIAKQDVLQFAEATATIGVTTNVSAEQAATSLGILSNLLGLQGVEFERFGSALVDLGNKGASTEAQIIEIAERASGAAATIGLSADQLLGWSSAIANIGMAPDAAGTAFQTFGLEIQKFVSKGGSELKLLGEVAGTTAKEFEKAFEQDASGALESFIDGLAKLDKGERADVLNALGFNEARIRRMLLGLAEAESNTDNVSKSLNISAEAWAANTAAAEEADKRYGTVASKLQLLNNQFIEGALLVGEGFLPALGKVADKLKVALGDEGTRNDLRKLGQDLGAAIDDIDWQEVIKGAREFAGVLKTALGISKGIFDVVNRMPTEVKAAAAAFLVLNKASGGLIGAGAGTLLGGLAETAIRAGGSKMPGLGRLFAQPVFVTNWPMGGLGGGAGGPGGLAAKGGGLGAALGGGALLGAAATAASAAAVAGALIAVQKLGIEPGHQSQAGSNIEGTQAIIARGDADELQSAIDGLRAMPDKLNPLERVMYDLNANGVKVHTESLITAMEERLGNVTKNDVGSPDDRQEKNDFREHLKTEIAPLRKQMEDTTKNTERVRQAAQETTREAKRGLDLVRDAASETERAAKVAGQESAFATRDAESGISATIRANRPIITTIVRVTANSYTKDVTTQRRYGAGNGSRNSGNKERGPTEYN